MNRVLELKQKRGEVAQQAKDLIKLAQDQQRAMTTEESDKYDALLKDVVGFTRTLDAMTRETELDKALEDVKGAARERRGAGQGDEAKAEEREAFKEWLRGGEQFVDPERRSLLKPGLSSSTDFRPSAGQTRAAQSALTGSLGGYLVPQGFWSQVIEALKYYGGMFEAGCTIISTDMGNDLPIPVENDTSIMGQELAENSPETTQEKTFGQVVMKAYKYSSRMIAVPIELLQDSGVDIEGLIVRNLATRLGRIQNLRFTTGDGNGRPRGVTIDATEGVTAATGHTLDVIYDYLVGLKYSVNRSYRSNAKWMMGDAMLQVILKLKDSQGRPLILDYLNALQAGEPEKILGQPIVINNDMADPAANAKTILYGDFRNYWIRRVMNMLMMRLTERYAEAGQVAFLAFMRTDGRMVDAGTHPIKYYAQSAS